jgi:hypothetical protein
MTGQTAQYDPQLGYMPAVPLPFYCWQFWKWQKVRCHCGKEFVTRDKSLCPIEYERHYVLTHVDNE